MLRRAGRKAAQGEYRQVFRKEAFTLLHTTTLALSHPRTRKKIPWSADQGMEKVEQRRHYEE
jgi:hypothetical protein